jgi:uncharacterized protein
MNIVRDCALQVSSGLELFPVVALVGPRQVGKTTLARAIADGLRARGLPVTMLDLERPSDLAKLAEPELFLEPLADQLVVLDEIQLAPDLFPVLRSLVDTHRRPGRLLLLGSAAPVLIQRSAETLAGRIEFIEVPPLTLAEISANAGGASLDPDLWRMLWQRGGYPDSFLARSDAASMRWRAAFVQSYLERDIPQLGIRIPASQLRRFWQMLAHHHGQQWNASTIAGSLGVSAPTVRHYLDLLEGTFMVRVLQPYFANISKRLVKSPKVYLRDSGILHALLNLPTRAALMGHPTLGASWEGWVIEQVIQQAPTGTRTFYYRTASGNEIDLVLELPGGQKRAIEIKYSATPKLGRGFVEALDDLGIERGYVITPIQSPYPISARARALPATDFSEIWT